MIPLGLYGAAQPVVSGGAAFTYLGHLGATNDASTYSLTGAPLGAANASRNIVIATMARNGPGGSRPLISATIGGVTATIDALNNNATGDTAAIIRATVPTGTTGTVGLAFSSTVSRVAIGVYSYDGSLTLTATGGEANNTNDNSMTATLTGSAAGDLLVAGAHLGSATNTAAWSGAIEDFEAVYEIAFTGAHGVAAASNASVSATLTESIQFKAMAAAAYQGA